VDRHYLFYSINRQSPSFKTHQQFTLMEYYNLLFLAAAFLMLFISVSIIDKIIPLEINDVKHPEIDGLRGYLAFLVFLHHSYIWHNYLHSSEWRNPESNLFSHFGQSSVALFFVITAFLFVSKLMEANAAAFNWKRYIISRFYRLAPMYLFSVVFIFILAAAASDFEIKDSILNITKSSLSWLFFTIHGSVDINNLKDTQIINSGVAWTLPYEWMFYFLLPVIALFFKIKVKAKVLIPFIVIFIIILAISRSSMRNFSPFIAGIIVAIIIKKAKDITFLRQPKYALLVIILLSVSVYFFNSGKKIIPVIITGIVFLIIAAGNSMFGILSTRFSRKFGQITYSIYLLHGILLFTTFRFIIGYEKAALLTPFEYLGVIVLCAFPLIFISQLTYKYIELPFINFAKRKR